MTSSGPPRATTRRLPAIVVGGLLLVVAAVGCQLLTSTPSTRATSTVGSSSSSSWATPFLGAPPEQQRGSWGEAEGAVPDGTTVFDDELPGVANLDAALLAALRRAATDAADDGIDLHVNSGWRSPGYQDQLLREAVAEHGSEEEAARWVATAETSPHVSGDAVDVGPSEATGWLSEHGDDHGLCQIYGNEPWHYELRPDAVADGCPPMYADPTEDPRMQP